MKTKVLLLSANPKKTNSLRLSEEFRNIKESIKISQYRDSFEVFQGEAVRPKDLRRLLLEVSPHIIHFSGHGETDGIVLENENGEIKQLKGELLGEMFSFFESINCVILNACYSANQTKYLEDTIPYIIGMSAKIKDQSSIRFSMGFYDALASNRPIEDAFKFGINAIKIWQKDNNYRSLDIEEHEKEEGDIPILLKGNITRSMPIIAMITPSNPLINSFWDNLSPSLQDALMLAANAARREGKDIISTRTLFSALRRLNSERLPSFFEQIPEDALPSPTKEEIQPNVNALSEIRLFSNCVQDSLEHLVPKTNPHERLTAEDIFVDIARNGTGNSVRRLRAHGVDASRINEILQQLGWSVVNR